MTQENNLDNRATVCFKEMVDTARTDKKLNVLKRRKERTEKDISARLQEIKKMIRQKHGFD